MAPIARARHVAQHVPDVRPIGDPAERFGERRALGSGGRRVHGEIDRRAAAGPGQVHPIDRLRPVRRRSDVGAAADLAGQQAAPGGQRIGTADRPDRDAELPGHIALRRQPGAGGKLAGTDRRFDRRGECPIARPVVLGEVWSPDCHGNNLEIDT